MQWILAWHQDDGPTQWLMAQIDFHRYFPDAICAADPDALQTTMAAQTGPVAVFLISPQDVRDWNDNKIHDLVQDLCQRADAVVLVINELDAVWMRLSELARMPRLWIMAPGQHNYGAGHRPFVIWQHWIQDLQITWRPSAIQHRLGQIDPGSPRPYLFDVLLGGKRPYRTRLHDLIESDTVLRDRVVMSYYGAPTTRPQFIPEPDMPDWTWSDPMHTGMHINYKGTGMRIACVPPVSIYQQTHITVLAETSAHGVLNFYTEKVAKPLLAGRPFLAIGGQYYLRGLRDSEFLTFSPIIDESYDLEFDDDARVDMVFREMQRLSSQDPATLSNLLQHQIQHNRELAWHRDFAASAVFNARQLVERHWKFSFR